MPLVAAGDRRPERGARWSAVRGAKRILVVEDEGDVRSYLVETLKDLNYRVREAPDGGGRAGAVSRPIRSGSICF